MNMKVKKLLMMNSPLILDKPINKKSEDILDFDIFFQKYSEYVKNCS